MKIRFALYPSRAQTSNSDDAKAPGLNDRKLVHISNIDQLAIVQPRELWHCQNSKFEPGWGIVYWIFLVSAFNFLHGSECTVDIGTGIRQDALHWNISGGPYGPNILSELKWKDLKIWEVYAELKFVLPYQIYFRFNGDYGKIFEGRNKDADYLEDNRKEPFSIAFSKANKGEVFDFSFGSGYQYSFFQDRLTVSPLAGFSHQEQHLRMIHGKLALDLFDPLLEGSMSTLHSHYRSQWWGPWLGVDVNFAVCSNLEIYGTYEYHWAFYTASGHWNLRTDFTDDFEHSGNGCGSLVKLGTKYNFCSGLDIGILFKYQLMQLRHGIDRIFVLDGSHAISAATRLNEVNWHTFSFLCTFGYAF